MCRFSQTVAELRPKIDYEKEALDEWSMKDHVDKSLGIVTRITEDLSRIKPTETKISPGRSSQETKMLRFLKC
jgi:hypothetical protein